MLHTLVRLVALVFVLELLLCGVLVVHYFLIRRSYTQLDTRVFALEQRHEQEDHDLARTAPPRFRVTAAPCRPGMVLEEPSVRMSLLRRQ